MGAQLRVQTRYLSLPGEMGSISTSSTLGDVEFEEVEAVGDVAAEAAKEEGSELARSSLAGELEEEVVMVDVKLRSVLRGFLTVSAPPLVLLLLLILVGKGQVVGGEVKEGPLESIHLNIRVIFDLTLHCLYVLCLPGKSRRRKVVVIGVLSGW